MVYDHDYIDYYIDSHVINEERLPTLGDYVNDSVYDILFENCRIVMTAVNIGYLHAQYTYPILSLSDADANSSNSHDRININTICVEYDKAIRRLAMLSSKVNPSRYYRIYVSNVNVTHSTKNMAEFDFDMTNCFIVADNKYAVWMVVKILLENSFDFNAFVIDIYDRFREEHARETSLDKFVEYMIDMVVVSEYDYYCYAENLTFYIVETNVVIIDQ